MPSYIESGQSLLIKKLYFLSGFLELINNMLTSGMVPALYADDEKEAILSGVSLLHWFIYT